MRIGININIAIAQNLNSSVGENAPDWYLENT